MNVETPHRAGAEAETTDAERRPATSTASTKRPRVLVIVVHWNALDATTRCLESLSRLTYPDHHVIVIDNASTDGSGAALVERFPDLEFIHNDENLLFAGGANTGLKRGLARGYDHSIILNNDTEVAPDLIERLLEVAARQPQNGLIGPKILYADRRDVIWSAGGQIDFWAGMFHHLGLRQPDGPAFDAERSVDYLTGCCIMITRPALVDIGYLDTGYHMYSEDADWSMRARLAGYRVVYAPSARVWHEVSAASGGGTSPYKMYHRVHSNLRFLQRYARPYHWPSIVLRLPFEFVRFAIGEVRRGNGRAVRAGLTALFDLVRRAPRRTP